MSKEKSEVSILRVIHPQARISMAIALTERQIEARGRINAGKGVHTIPTGAEMVDMARNSITALKLFADELGFEGETKPTTEFQGH